MYLASKVLTGADLLHYAVGSNGAVNGGLAGPDAQSAAGMRNKRGGSVNYKTTRLGTSKKHVSYRL